MPEKHLITFKFIKQILDAQPVRIDQVKLSAIILGRKVKGYKPGDKRKLTDREIEHFRKELAAVVEHWNINGNSDKWDCEEIIQALSFKVRFKRKMFVEIKEESLVVVDESEEGK